MYACSSVSESLLHQKVDNSFTFCVSNLISRLKNDHIFGTLLGLILMAAGFDPELSTLSSERSSDCRQVHCSLFQM